MTNTHLLAFSVLLLFSTVVSNTATGSPLTTIYVDPSASTVKVGQTFTINIKISDVTDLYGWEFKLAWDPAILDALDVFEGEFLRRGGETYPLIKQINNTQGYLLASCSLIGDKPGVSGSGTLATVEFYAEKEGTSVLDLYDTKLVNSYEQSITHTAIDGSVTISKSVGGFVNPATKLELPVSRIELASAIGLATFLIVVFTKRKKMTVTVTELVQHD